MRDGALRYADDSANLKRRAVGEDIVTVHRTPLVTPWRGAEMTLAVIDFIAAIPVFVFDWSTFLPFLVLDVCMVVVMVLGKGDAAHKASGKNRERQNSVQLFHCQLLQNLDAHETSRVVRVPVGFPTNRTELQDWTSDHGLCGAQSTGHEAGGLRSRVNRKKAKTLLRLPILMWQGCGPEQALRRDRKLHLWVRLVIRAEFVRHPD
jgi:hypothetical protein